MTTGCENCARLYDQVVTRGQQLTQLKARLRRVDAERRRLRSIVYHWRQGIDRLTDSMKEADPGPWNVT